VAPLDLRLQRSGEATDQDRELLETQDTIDETTVPDEYEQRLLDIDREIRLNELKQGKQETKRLKQANKLRARFMKYAWRTVWACTACSALGVFIALWIGQATSAVMTAFIAGVTVEAIGILVIVANYLFEPRRK